MTTPIVMGFVNWWQLLSLIMVTSQAYRAAATDLYNCQNIIAVVSQLAFLISLSDILLLPCRNSAGLYVIIMAHSCARFMYSSTSG